MHFHGGWMFGMGWLWILLAVGIIALVAWLVARAAGGRPPRTDHRSERPEDILQRRLAEGEIDEEEYRRRLEALRRPGSRQEP